MASRRVGLFGGTFDPPHLGHVAAAEAVLAALALDELVVTVANEPQGKGAPPVAPAAERVAMAAAAFAGLASVSVSDLEVRRGGPTFTIDTVEALLAGEPSARLVVVVGADAATSLPTWRRAGALAVLVEVAVVPREGAGTPDLKGFSVIEVPMAPVDLSSTGVRARLAAGEDPAALVPPGVVPLLLTNRLYAP